MLWHYSTVILALPPRVDRLTFIYINSNGQKIAVLFRTASDLRRRDPVTHFIESRSLVFAFGVQDGGERTRKLR